MYGKRYAIWPGNNHFFTLAISDLLIKKHPCYISDGVVYVDFSIENILLFLNIDRVIFLTELGLKIFLVTDREMLPMANYWLMQAESIIAVLNSEKGVDGVIKDARRALSGRKCNYRKLPAMTSREMAVLSQLVAGVSISNIADNLNCTMKSVYEHQYSLCKKFGGLARLRELYIRQATLQV